MATQIETHTCPICGMARLMRDLDAGALGGHALQSMIKHCVGRGKGGFQYERTDRSRDARYIREMLERLRAACDQLEMRLKTILEMPETLPEGVLIRPIVREEVRVSEDVVVREQVKVWDELPARKRPNSRKSKGERR